MDIRPDDKRITETLHMTVLKMATRNNFLEKDKGMENKMHTAS